MSTGGAAEPNSSYVYALGRSCLSPSITVVGNCCRGYLGYPTTHIFDSSKYYDIIASVWKKDPFFKLHSSGTNISMASSCQSGRDREFGIPESVLVVKTTVIARSASRKRTAADLPADPQIICPCRSGKGFDRSTTPHLLDCYRCAAHQRL